MRLPLFLIAGFLSVTGLALAEVPRLLQHQGRMAVNGTPFDGTGLFKLALVNADGTQTYWSNDGTSTAGSQPAAAVSLTVVKGLYSVLLGDPGLANMAALPDAVFEHEDLRLRIWFNDGVKGFQQITPDQRLVSTPFALRAAKAATAGQFTGPLSGDVTGPQGATSIAAATITGKKLDGFSSQAGSITAADSLLSAFNKLDGNIALRAPLASPTFTGTVTGTFSGNGSALTQLNGGSLAAGTVAASALASDSVTSAKISDGAIVNADVAGNAAIAYGKLDLTGSVVDADIHSAAAIADTKLAVLATPGKVANSATTGTSANAPGTLVLRDAAGNFSAGTITGTFVGDGSGLTGISGSSSALLEDLQAHPAKPVVCWGGNDFGQTAVPPSVTGANTSAIAAGGDTSLALLKNGTLVQWGAGAAVPSGLSGVTRIAVGAAHRLARKSDGSVTAWGDDTYGQSTVPGGIANAIDVAAGEKHSLALLSNGTVVAWGDNTFGQTTVPSAATNVIAIAAGADHNLALKADGSIVAWGRDETGQTTPPPGLAGVTAIACGAYHSLALKNDGSVEAWGWDIGGQCAVPAGLGQVTKIAAGYAFSLALRGDGTLVAWGDNTDHQLDPPAAAADVAAIACGLSHAIALREDLVPAQVARLDQDNVMNGSLGVKRSPASNTLEVEGSASKTTAGNWLANSDRRIKTDIRPVENALETLDRVRLVGFHYTGDYLRAHPGLEDRTYLNVIAQEFAEVFPEHVRSSGEKLADGSEILQVDTYPLTIYSAAAVQELRRENQELRRQMQAQEERLRRIEAAIRK